MFENIHQYLVKLEGINVQPHFDKISYRIGSSIVATFNENTLIYTVKLSLVDQESFSILYPNSVYPVPNKWGNQGWTHIDWELMSEKDVKEVVFSAYRNVQSKSKMKK